MSRISDEDKDKVREATDIVALIGEYVELRQRGRDFWGNCPFHHEKTPSFKVSPQNQNWHCFGCGEGGDAFSFLMKKEQLEFPEAVRFLAERAHITITEQEGGMPSSYKGRLYEACREAAEFYHIQLMRGKSQGCAEARAYLGSRGLGGSIPNKWNLGYAPGHGSLITHLKSKGFTLKEMQDVNLALESGRGTGRDRFYERVMFPIRDERGRTIAFGGRIIGSGEPKYINTSNCPLFSKRHHLYGIDLAKTHITSKGSVVVVEGYTDVIAMHEAGFDNVVATLGTALTPEHLRVLRKYLPSRIIYLFDGDAAGQRAADRASELITPDVTPESGTKPVTLSVAVIPDGLDPAEFIAERGADAMEVLLGNAEPLLRFAIDRRISASDMSTPESRLMALPTVLQPLIPIRTSILSDEYVNYVADIFHLEFSSVRRTLDRMKAPRQQREQDDPGLRADIPVEKVPAQPSYSIPSEGSGRWEAQILCMYAQQPQVRMKIIQEMRGSEWSVDLHARLFALMTSMDTATSTSQMVARCTDEFPESEPLWAVTIPGSEDPEMAQYATSVMLRERSKAMLGEAIRTLENRIKHDRSLSAQEREELFAKISSLQKQLADLRSR